ncbi:MAG: hypothetical protein ACKN9W_14205 [Methylococcus sp.]
MAFLHRAVNGDGTLEREHAIGSGRMDLCLRYGDLTLGMELKVWRDGVPDPLAEGLEQLDGYLAGLGLASGWLVLFDRRTGQPPIAERRAHHTPDRRQPPGSADRGDPGLKRRRKARPGATRLQEAQRGDDQSGAGGDVAHPPENMRVVALDHVFEASSVDLFKAFVHQVEAFLDLLEPLFHQREVLLHQGAWALQCFLDPHPALARFDLMDRRRLAQ